MTHAPSTAALEPRIRRIGHEIFERARRAEPSPLNAAWWQQQLLGWVMRDETLKVQLFRFIEALPRLRGPEAVADHLRQYLRGGHRNGTPLPGVIDLVTGFENPRSIRGRLAAFAARTGSLRMAGTFIAGTTAEEAIATVTAMRRANMTFTLDVLGETVLCSQDSDHLLQVHLDVIEAMAASAPSWPANPLLDDTPYGPLPRVNISVKLSALAPRFDALAYEKTVETVLGRLRPMLLAARRRGAFVNIDLEHYAVKDLTFDIFMRVMSEPDFRDWADVGVVVQAYLRESESDLRRLLDWLPRRGTPIAIRLVKGAYWDSETAHAVAKHWPIPVWTNKWESDASYEKLSRIMLENHRWIRPAFASHNVRSLAAAMAIAGELGLPPRTLEIQMLYGMGEPLKHAVIGMNQRLRVYTPFGELMPGMAYFIRRLLENTANESFLRQSFSDNVPEDVLLAPPAPRPGAPATPLPGVHAGGSEDDAAIEHEPETNFADGAARQRISDAIRKVAAQSDRRCVSVVAGRPIETGAWRELRNPSRPAEIIARVATLSPEQFESNFAGVLLNTSPRADQPPAERTKALSAGADLLRNRRDEFTAMLIMHLGKTWRDADADVAAAIDALDYAASPGAPSECAHGQRGWVAVFTDFSGALSGPAQALAAALAAGNDVRWKPDLPSAAIAYELANTLLQAGLSNALHLVFGDDALDAEILESVKTVAINGDRAMVDRISGLSAQHSTRSADSHRLIRQTATTNSIIIDDDTNIDEAVLGTLAAAFTFAGQARTSVSQVITVGKAYANVVERLTAAAREIAVGPADDPATSIGPLIDEGAVQRAAKLVESARRDARCVVECRHPELIAQTSGHYFGPVVFTEVRDDFRLAGTAIAAPILFVLAADSLTAAMMKCAAPSAGVVSLYSRSPDNIARLRRELRCEQLFINRKVTAGMLERQPFSGSQVAAPHHQPTTATH